MNYTVQKLAKLSHVSIRTLRHYDAIGLLKPAFVGENKYRYYQEKQLLRLQQILFFKELGFGLKQIKNILDRNDFDTCKALQQHAKMIEQRMKRMRELLQTIDKTIKHLKGNHVMNIEELYHCFDTEKQKQYEKDLESYFVQQSKEKQKVFAQHQKETTQNVAQWTKVDWAASSEAFDTICKDLTALLKQKVKPVDKQTQEVIAHHFQWLSKFWKPNKESYKWTCGIYCKL